MNPQITNARFISAVLTNPSALDELDITPEDLTDRRHAEILRAIIGLRREGIPPTIHAIGRRYTDRLRNPTPEAQDACEQMLIELAQMSGVGTAEAEAALIKSDAKAHRLLDAGLQIQKLATAPGLTSNEKIAKAEEVMTALSSGGGVGQNGTKMIGQVAREYLAKLKEKILTGDGKTGYEIGISELDDWTGGAFPGDVTIIAARPRMGKTSFAMDIGRVLAETRDARVAVITMEMRNESIVERFVASDIGVSVLDQRRGRVTPIQEQQIEAMVGRLEIVTIAINDRSTWTAASLRIECMRLFRTLGIQLFIIDYFSLLTPDNSAKGYKSMDDVSKAITGIAKDLPAHFFLLAQLNRDCEKREDKRPMLSDLRETGQIEQDATNVIFIHRPIVYDENADPELAELIVAKSRNGETGTILQRFDAPRVRFLPWTKGAPTAPAQTNRYAGMARGLYDPFDDN